MIETPFLPIKFCRNSPKSVEIRQNLYKSVKVCHSQEAIEHIGKELVLPPSRQGRQEIFKTWRSWRLGGGSITLAPDHNPALRGRRIVIRRKRSFQATWRCRSDDKTNAHATISEEFPCGIPHQRA
jgi:hypothetical protein